MFDLLRPVISLFKNTPAVFSSSENSLRVAQGRVLRIWPMRQKVALRGKELKQKLKGTDTVFPLECSAFLFSVKGIVSIK